ncbi:helicase-associated domain-containing protein [Protofrankia symbiont of Coriaria ruscifolia]|uniref:helicase-associated domain-containing protein n=1 Tax=Protofrankia symbiont of Coriaria ruscifolia TaxID=1306542 RepID=UPI0010412826|nr:helicase-associated domain-containing protein [Protofrankia symbiont of Coriaria ruscifolia]
MAVARDVNETTDGSSGAGELTVRLGARDAAADALAVLQLCAAGKLRCSEKTQRPAAATVAAVAGVLLRGDFYREEPIAAFAWPLLLQAGGLAEVVGGRLQLTARGRAALAKPVAETIRHLWRRWVGHAVIDEMGRIEEIKGQRSARALTAAAPRRKAVAEALAVCAPGEWVAVDDLFTRIRRDGPSFAVARDVWKLYLEDPQYGSLGYDGFHEWSLLEGRYVLCLLFEYAGTLGLFDLEYGDPVDARDDFRGNWGADDLDFLSRYDGLYAVRLNALGAYVFGLAERYEPEKEGGGGPGPALKVLPNLDIVVTGEVQPADELFLDAYGQRSSDRVWSLGLASLMAAIDVGRPLEDLRRFLDDHADHDIPATVTRLFEDVTARAGQLRDLGLARVVECADPAVAALIVGDRRLRRFCRPLGERHVAVPLQHEADFRTALRKLGYVIPAEPGA